MVRKCTLPLLCVFVLPLSIAAQAPVQDPVRSITIAELRDHIFYLASDDLEGRYTGSAGYEIAAKYCASQFAAAGLTRITTTADGNPTYLQTVPIVIRSIEEEIILGFTTASGSSEFTHIDDFRWAEGEMCPEPEAPREVVFIGYGIIEPDHGWNDVENLDLKGKTAVMLVGAPARDGVPVLPEEVNNRYLSLDGVGNKFMPLLDMAPAALMIIAEEILLGMWDQIPVVSSNTQMAYAMPGSDMSIPMIDLAFLRRLVPHPTPQGISKMVFPAIYLLQNLYRSYNFFLYLFSFKPSILSLNPGSSGCALSAI